MEAKIGDSYSISREITDELVRKFAEVSGDYNPIHLDDEFASKTRFGKRIAHGMLSGAFISAILGNELKGQTVIYLSQTLKFVAPVFIGDIVTTTSTITDIREEKGIVTFENICTNQSRETLVKGESVIMILSEQPA
ncbi:MAG: MaoC family dehydratase [Pyrinomonadaceae bacterium]